MEPKKSVLPYVFLAAGVLLAAFALYLWVSGRRQALASIDNAAISRGTGDHTVGQTAPDFTLDTPDGSTLSLSQFRGHPVVVNYWATWCPPCREEMPLFQRRHEKYSDLVILAVDGGEDAGTVAKFVNQLNLTFPVLLDPEYKVESLLGILGYPTTLFIDSDGIIRAKQIGQLNDRLLDEYLNKIGVSE